MMFDIPRNRMLGVDTAELAFDAGPHPYEAANIADIEANWQAETARNPALFDGRVMLFSTIRFRDGRLDGRCHAIRFATFMHWRRTRAESSAEHLFAQAMPVAADGALVAIRMGAHTANAGKVYFAAGSFDLDDLRDGRIDIGSNMRREVLEETGIDLAECRRDPGLHGHSADSGTVLTQRYFLDAPADAVAARIRAFIAADPDPEIADAVIIRRPDDLPEGLMPHMVPLVKWHFGG
ncbi:MAG: NUDIX hydrolase [Mesorhizobium sp.]|nr:NUDIX hydrolase [Mesorhizobium sp.]